MSRPPAPCGTPTAYRRHKRNREEPCAPCQAAWEAEQAAKREEAEAAAMVAVLDELETRAQEILADSAPAAVVAAGATLDAIARGEDVDALEEMRANLRMVLASSVTATPGAAAALSKRRQELVDRIAELQRERDAERLAREGATTQVVPDEVKAFRKRRERARRESARRARAQHPAAGEVTP